MEKNKKYRVLENKNNLKWKRTSGWVIIDEPFILSKFENVIKVTK